MKTLEVSLIHSTMNVNELVKKHVMSYDENLMNVRQHVEMNQNEVSVLSNACSYVISMMRE